MPDIKKIIFSFMMLLINMPGFAGQEQAAVISNADSIKQEALSAHNKWRALHHAPALIWDEALASYAQDYVNQCQFKHSSSPYGENLAAGFPSISSAVNTWYAESKQYSYANPGFSLSTGHFTQVVWKATQKIGCAYANCNGKNATPGIFWVCEYSPGGNVINKGFFAANVSVSQPQASQYDQNTIAHFYGLKSTKNLSLLAVKGYQQTESYTCAPAAIMSLLHYYGMLKDTQLNKETELKIAKEMGTSSAVGTSPQQIVNWLKKHGFDVQTGENGTIQLLQENLKKGIPTMVEWIDWGGHWELVAGYDAAGKTYDEDKDTIFFADPSVHFNNVKYMNGLSTFNPDRFADMWFDAQYFNPGHLVRGIYIIAVPKKSI